MDSQIDDGIEDIGLIISSLQDDLRDVRIQLENLPGYPKGEVPLHLVNLQKDLISTEKTLQSKNEELIQNMMRNFGETAQDLPNMKLPDIRRLPSKENIDSSLGFTDFRDIRLSASKLKVAPSLRKEYGGKRALGNKRSKKHKLMKREIAENFIPDPPPISDEDINRGMINLINKGIIPKDVDITPAFERGAPPLSLKPAQIHFGDPKDFIRREVATGPTYHKAVKYDLQPEEDRALSIMPATSSELVPFSGGSVGISPMQGSPLEIEQDHDKYDENTERINDPEFDDEQLKSQENQRGYNELLDEFSLHQFIIRKGKCLDDTPEFLSFKRTYISKWGSISYIIHLLEKMLTSSNVPIAIIEGKKLADLSNEDLKKPKNEDLFD